MVEKDMGNLVKMDSHKSGTRWAKTSKSVKRGLVLVLFLSSPKDINPRWKIEASELALVCHTSEHVLLHHFLDSSMELS